jgi:tetratricopeptide (TPR) repeat protein
MLIRQWRLEGQLRRCLAQNQWLAAAQTAATLAWYRPGDVGLIFQRAELAEKSGDLAASADLLATVPADSQRAADAFETRAMILSQLFRLEAAEAAYRQTLQLNPRRLEARRGLVGLLGIQRRSTDQLAQLWAWQQSGVAVVEALRLMAQSVVIIPPGTLARTLDEGVVLENALAAEPASPHLRPALARFYRNRGEVPKALQLLEIWANQNPADTPAGLERLGCLVESGDVDQAAQLIAKAPPAWLQQAEFWLVSGDNARNQGDWTKAWQAYLKAIELDPRAPEAYYRLADCLRALNQPAEAADMLKKHDAIKQLAELAAAVAVETPDPTAMLKVARACRSLNRPAEAAAWATEVLKIQRDNAEARAILDQTK